MEVETVAIRGTYEELVDAAEDLADILNAEGHCVLDLTPAVRTWLAEQLETVELALVDHLDGDDAAACPPALRGTANRGVA